MVIRRPFGVRLLFGPTLAAACLAHANPNIEDFARRAEESLERNRDYEVTSVAAFWGDASFMAKCAPAGSPLSQPFTIYFEVLEDGRLGSLVFNPRTPSMRFTP